MNKIIGHIKRVFMEILPPFVFFLIMFHMLLISRALILKRHGIATRASAIAVVAAFVVAKVVFIANRIPALNLYPKKPLIYSVVLKTVIFSIATMLFMMVEEFARLSRKDGFAGAWSQMAGDFSLQIFFVRQIWVFILILLYCAGSELTRIIGIDKVKEIFFGRAKGQA